MRLEIGHDRRIPTMEIGKQLEPGLPQVGWLALGSTPLLRALSCLNVCLPEDLLCCPGRQ